MVAMYYIRMTMYIKISTSWTNSRTKLMSPKHKKSNIAKEIQRANKQREARQRSLRNVGTEILNKL